MHLRNFGFREIGQEAKRPRGRGRLGATMFLTLRNHCSPKGEERTQQFVFIGLPDHRDAKRFFASSVAGMYSETAVPSGSRN